MNSVFEKDLEEIINSNEIDWNMLENSNIFITGSTGLIGSIIVRAIQFRNKRFNSNINLCLLVRSKEKAINLFGKDERINYIESNTEDFKPESMNIDYIIHAASPTKSKYFVEQPVETIKTAVYGTTNMLELARLSNVKSFIYLSSMEMYGTMTSDNVTENDLGYINPLNVRSSYSEGKRMCELISYSYMSEYNVPVKIGRIAQTFGPGIDVERENRVYKFFADKVLNGEDIILKSSGTTIINYGYTTDVVKGLLCILLRGKVGEAYNIVCDKTNMTIKDSAEWLVETYGQPGTKVVIDIPEYNAGFAPDNNMVLTNDKIKGLGWTPEHDVKYGYDHLLDYMKEEYKKKDDTKVKKLV